MRKIISVFLIFLMLNTQIGCVMAFTLGPFNLPLTGNPWVDGNLKSALRLIYSSITSAIKFFKHPYMLTPWELLPWWATPGVTLGIPPWVAFPISPDNVLNIFGGWAGYMENQIATEVPKLFQGLLKIVKLGKNFYGIYVPGEALKKFVLLQLLLLYMGVKNQYTKIFKALVDLLGGFKEALAKVIVGTPEWLEYVIQSIPQPKISTSGVASYLGSVLGTLLTIFDKLAQAFMPGWSFGFNIGDGFLLVSWSRVLSGYLNHVINEYKFYWIKPNLTIGKLASDISYIFELPRKVVLGLINDIKHAALAVEGPIIQWGNPQCIEWHAAVGILNYVIHLAESVAKKFLSLLVTYRCVSDTVSAGLDIHDKLQIAYKMVDIILGTINTLQQKGWSLRNLGEALLDWVLKIFGIGLSWAEKIMNLIMEIPKLTWESRDILWKILTGIKNGIDGVVYALRWYVYQLLLKPLLDWVHSVLNGLLNGIKMVFKSGVEWMDKYILYPVQKFGVYLNNEIRSWFGMDVGYVIVGR